MTLRVALLEECINDLLFLPNKLFAFLKVIGLAFNIDDDTVMQNTVEDSKSDGDVSKDFVPLGKDLVGSKDSASLLITSGDELEKEVSALNIHSEIADLVNDTFSF